jgi:DNA invertase Pin-like site-specific DNA recombinase
MLYGYARVSTTDLDLSLQIDALRNAGCDVIREEKKSGTSVQGRTELALLLEFIRAGDILLVTRMDRLARSVGDLQDIVRALNAKGVALRATEQPIDTSTAAGNAFLDMLSVFAEFETNLRRERQMEGIIKAKAAGVYKGRTKTIDPEAVRQAAIELKLGPAPLARRLGISRASVYRALDKQPRVAKHLKPSESSPAPASAEGSCTTGSCLTEGPELNPMMDKELAYWTKQIRDCKLFEGACTHVTRYVRTYIARGEYPPLFIDEVAYAGQWAQFPPYPADRSQELSPKGQARARWKAACKPTILRLWNEGKRLSAIEKERFEFEGESWRIGQSLAVAILREAHENGEIKGWEEYMEALLTQGAKREANKRHRGKSS